MMTLMRGLHFLAKSGDGLLPELVGTTTPPVTGRMGSATNAEATDAKSDEKTEKHARVARVVTMQLPKRD